MLKQLLIHVVAPLALGTLIYFFTRTHSIYFLKWLDETLVLQSPRQYSVPKWVAYNLPDGLWMFAFSSLMLILWKRTINRESLIWLASPLMVALVLEHAVGHFDPADILALFVGALTSLILYPKTTVKFKKTSIA